MLAVELRSAQFTSPLITLCKSANVFSGMLTSEKERVVEEHKLCLCCLLPGHCLSKCRSKNRCKVENCDMHHHTPVHEVNLKFMNNLEATLGVGAVSWRYVLTKTNPADDIT